MRSFLRSLSCGLALFLFAAPAFAEKFSYPDEDKPLFSIDVPKTWKPKVSKDETLEATSPDKEAYIAFWTMENAKEIASLGKDLGDLLKESVTKLKLPDKPTQKTINGITFTIFQGTGVDKEDNSDVGVEIFLFSPKKGMLGLFYCQYGQKAPEAINGLVKIVESIQLTKK